MGNIKIEFIDIPNFEKELKIEIVLRKDGEEIKIDSSSPYTGIEDKKESQLTVTPSIDSVENSQKEINPTNTNQKKKFGGNMMDLEF